MPATATPKTYALLVVPFVFLLLLVAGVQESRAQDIRTRLTAFDNVGNSTELRIGIVPSASDGIDPALGEAILSPPAPNTWDARLIDTDFRSPTILGNGVLRDFRGIYTGPPISQTFEIRVRRDPLASNTWLRWDLPLATGISSMRLVSHPDPTVLDIDMSTMAQVLLPPGTNRYFIYAVYGDPPPTRYTLNVEINPPGKGQVFRVPFQLDYAPGDGVTLLAVNLPAPDTCYQFSHWSGDATGTNQILSISMTKSKTITANYAPRTFPVTVTALDTFVVDLNPPPSQRLYISNSGLLCYEWTASPSVPWLRLSKSQGTGNDSIDVEVITSAIPCPGTHAATIDLTSPFSSPNTIQIPVIVRIGKTDLTATVVGEPSILSCQNKATDLITVTIANAGLNDILFSTVPDLGEGFVLKNPGIFPLTVPARGDAILYVEFAPAPSQRGTIIENVIMSADACGQEILFKLTASRIAPTVTADVTELDFGLVNSCTVDPLPQRTIQLDNDFTQAARLRYTVPSGFTLVNAPDSIFGGTSADVTIEPARLGPESFDATIEIEADFGLCAERFSVRLYGQRQNPSFTAEAVDTPGALPPQLYDTTCVGSYSEAKLIRLRNNGTAELIMTVDVALPYIIDAFSNTFPLRPGDERIVPIRFHPTASGTFEEELTISANLCDLEARVMLRGSTFSQQVLVSTVAPAHVTLANCEPSSKILLQVTNQGLEPVRFTELPDLPAGFAWDPAVRTPIIIPADASSPFEAYIIFQPPLGEGGSFGGSVQWFGAPCGSTVYFTLSGERILPQVSITPSRVDFGQVIYCGTGGANPGRVVTVENNSPLPLTLNAIASTSKYELRYGAVPFPTQGVVVPAASSVDVDVFALPGSGGAFNDTLTLEIIAGTGGYCREIFPIVLTGERYEPRFSVRENCYSSNFGDVCVGASAVRGFIVENTGDRRMTISSDGFEDFSPFQLLSKPFRITLEPGTYREFPIRYSPMLNGADVAAVFFISDVCSDTVVFTLRGRGVQPAFAINAVVPPGTIDILTCETSLSRQVRATVENTGATPITISDGSLLPRGFEYDPPQQFPFTLQPGQTRDVVVRFVGTEPGAYSGMVTLFGQPCDVTDAFPIQARIIRSTYATAPEALDFGMITVCPGGMVRPGDIPRLRQQIEFRNTGEFPLTLDGTVKPLSAPLRILAPLTWPVIVPAGQTQTVTVEISPPFDELNRSFNGVVELSVTRDSRCVTETRSIPFSGQVNHLSYAFVSDTVRATVTCSTEPVELTAELGNAGIAPITLDLRIEGSPAFALIDTQPVTIPPGQRKEVKLLFTPDAGVSLLATLIASETQCGSQTSTALAVTLSRPELTISCSSGGAAPALSARPGDLIEIPVFLNAALTCPAEDVSLQFELTFDRRALTPDKVLSSQGTASFTRPSPDKLLVKITDASFAAGEVSKIVMEVLVGRTTSTQWTVAAPAFTPDIALLTTDATCSGTVTVRPRNGVATLSDLGITTLNPPRPNVIGGGSGNGQTMLTFSLKLESSVELKVFDILGVEVAVIHSGSFKRGTHSIRYTPETLRPGVYFVVMTAGSYRGMQKLIVAR
jgi:hypothetical protein